jgi:antitoxin component YwqK of YwqJK toxin-antitoxin module
MQRLPEERLEHRDDEATYFEGKPFSGVAFCEDDQGNLLYEIGYREGRRWGASREWYGSGEPATEQWFAWDWAYGPSRQWHGNGRLAEEARYEWGVCLERQRWDEGGVLLEAFVLAESDPEFTALQERRAQWGSVEW